MNINYRMVGIRIRKCRKSLNMSQARLAERAGLSSSYISLIECGSKKPSLSCLLKMASVLDTTLDHLVTGAVPPSTAKIEQSLSYIFKDCSDSDRSALIELLENAKTIVKKYDYPSRKGSER